MSSATAILKTEIVGALSCLNEDGLDEVRTHIATLVKATRRRDAVRTSLAGIWAGRGFGDLSDLE